MTTVYLPAKRNKYRNVRTVVDGITFASKKEAARYQELKLLGVSPLELQPKFDLVVNGIKICQYRADFAYEIPYSGGQRVVEDVKGKRTREYIIKKNLMLACKGIEIKEI